LGEAKVQHAMEYLLELEQNNNREWYHAHKAEYKTASAEFEAIRPTSKKCGKAAIYCHRTYIVRQRAKN
jgi:hypothetical protein